LMEQAVPPIPTEPPGDWPVDGCGRPVWITALSDGEWRGWRTLIPGVAITRWLPEWASADRDRLLANGPAAMPRLKEVAPPPLQVRRGAPGLARTNGWEACAAAWLRDVHGYRWADVARCVFPDMTSVPSKDGKRAKRLVKAGRVVLHRDETLPWCEWDDGEVPANWPNEDAFRNSLNSWLASPPSPPELTPKRRRTDHIRTAHARYAALARLAALGGPGGAGRPGMAGWLRNNGFIEVDSRLRATDGALHTLYRLTEKAFACYPCLSVTPHGA
jgi:hypothetical protein